jgi:chorismate mutase
MRLATEAAMARLSAMGDPVADELLRLRMSIDNMDAALVHLLAERFKVTQQVGELKAAHGLPPADPAREAQQIARLRALAEDAKLDPEFAEKFLNFVIAEVVRHHEAALDRRDAEAYVSHQNDGNERSIHT